jgi:COX assembly protein 1
MAAMAGKSTTEEQPSASVEKLGVPSRNPLPLSASQESQVRDIYYARVRKQCAEEIKGSLDHSLKKLSTR